MKCIHINIRQATFILLTFLTSRINMDDNQIIHPKISNVEKEKNSNENLLPKDLILHCPSNVDCIKLNEPCIICNVTTACHYGAKLNATCKVDKQISCKGTKEFIREYVCQYCYQTEPWEHHCEQTANCNSVSSPRATYTTNCTVRDDILCLGHRKFKKNVHCNWTGGYRWTTALALSITLGGFGADRFYLGHWQEGIGKLFSFGGLGVWTIIDVILISLHYLGPADGSLYI
ncbi:unnamed protein product [Callosobruchus maculatus]|uniref:TM2 domain-containing protein n=1 Tax=Callosobruchus maculatus TaxID=64391 RepID=A0A653BHN9_CALMS|nr:unnamed protein product [Callosobruchus maculatus]